MKDRKVTQVKSLRGGQGFLGQGHTAIPVIDGSSFQQTDPFILLMDDQLDLPGNGTVGGPHPHAGFETVTLVLEGDSNGKTFQTGSMEWMTAGSGIVHTEEIDTKVKMRILQLWLVLPKERRWAPPKWQELLLANAPVKKEGNNEIRVYSGTSQGLTAPMHNETPVTIVDFKLEAGSEAVQEIPASYNGFIYVINGTAEVGEERTVVKEYQVAWLERSVGNNTEQLRFRGGENGARFVFYAGAPQSAPIVSHGPFIGDTQDDIVRLYKEYREGKMGHVHDLPQEQVIRHI